MRSCSSGKGINLDPSTTQRCSGLFPGDKHSKVTRRMRKCKIGDMIDHARRLYPKNSSINEETDICQNCYLQLLAKRKSKDKRDLVKSLNRKYKDRAYRKLKLSACSGKGIQVSETGSDVPHSRGEIDPKEMDKTDPRPSTSKPVRMETRSRSKKKTEASLKEERKRKDLHGPTENDIIVRDPEAIVKLEGGEEVVIKAEEIGAREREPEVDSESEEVKEEKSDFDQVRFVTEELDIKIESM